MSFFGKMSGVLDVTLTFQESISTLLNEHHSWVAPKPGNQVYPTLIMSTQQSLCHYEHYDCRVSI